MFRSLGFVSLLVVLGIGAYIYSRQVTATSAPAGATANPRATVDVIGVKNDLLVIASAERRRFATDGKYAQLSDLISNGDISMPAPRRGDFNYSSDVSDTGFRITATYSGQDPTAPKTMSIDQSMQIGQ